MGDLVPVIVCDACGHELWGVGANEAQRHGWRRRNYNGGIFTLCDECVGRYEPIWKRRDAEAGEARRQARAA